jgi:hypothetical protein
LAKNPKKWHLEVIDFSEEFWSGQPGSNRRRPAWEFSNEFDVFFFCADTLVEVFRTLSVLASFSNFN